MNEKNVKILLRDLQFLVAELKSEVYSDTRSYLDSEDVRKFRKMTTEKQTDYENPWIFDGTPFLSEDINGMHGFVYCITNTLTGKRYIGRKYFWQLRNLEVEVGELKVKATGKNTTEGSSELTEDRKQFGNLVFKRDI